jgi:hypothetical protein
VRERSRATPTHPVDANRSNECNFSISSLSQRASGVACRLTACRGLWLKRASVAQIHSSMQEQRVDIADGPSRHRPHSDWSLDEVSKRRLDDS